MNLTKAVELFLKARKRREETKKAYRWSLGQHIEFLGPERDVKDIKPEEIDAWADQLDSRGLAEATYSKLLREVRAFWNWLAQRGYVEKSPFDVEVPTPQIKLLRNRAIMEEDRNAMLVEARQSCPRDYAILRFLTDTGCRAGGLYRLKMSCLDLKDRSASLEEKGGKEVEVFFGEETARALREWLAVRPDNAAHDYVFVSKRDGEPLNRRSLYSILSRIAKRAEVNGRFNTHAWRHDVGRRFFDAGLPATVVAAKLGHSSTNVTLMYYSNQNRGKLRDATDALSPA